MPVQLAPGWRRSPRTPPLHRGTGLAQTPPLLTGVLSWSGSGGWPGCSGLKYASDSASSICPSFICHVQDFDTELAILSHRQMPKLPSSCSVRPTSGPSVWLCHCVGTAMGWGGDAVTGAGLQPSRRQKLPGDFGQCPP